MSSEVDRVVYVFIDPYQGRPPKWIGGLVETGRRLSAEIAGRLEVVVFGLDETGVAGLLLDPPPDYLHLWPDGRLSDYDGQRFGQVLSPLLNRAPAPILLTADTPIGRDVTSRLAASGQARLIPRCVELKGRAEQVEAFRLVMGGQMERGAVLPLDRPIAATMWTQRLSLVPESTEGSRPPISVIADIPDKWYLEPLGLKRLNDAGLALEEADVVVAGGWGAGDEEGFALVAALAEALGGAVAGSAVAAERGWVSRSQQIGRSGRMVFPDVFVACGISGSVHFTSGMDQSGLIVAVNTDPHAPIFKRADIRIVGDLRRVLPILIDRVRERSRS